MVLKSEADDLADGRAETLERPDAIVRLAEMEYAEAVLVGPDGKFLEPGRSNASLFLCLWETAYAVVATPAAA